MGSTGKTVLGVAGFLAAVGCAAMVGVTMAADQPAAKEAAPKEVAPKDAGQTGSGYSGTFVDTTGHKGPLTCQVTQGEGEKWTLKFNGKNEGDQGPKTSREFTFALPGKKDGTTLNLSGTHDLGRGGQYEVTMAVTDKTVEGKFKKADGKNTGTFSLTPAKSAQ